MTISLTYQMLSRMIVSAMVMVEAAVIVIANNANVCKIMRTNPVNNYFSRSSFTLIELLIVLAVLSILSITVILTINPSEFLKQARDSTRLSDMANINSSLNLFVVDSPDASLGTASTTYISVPDPTATSTSGNYYTYTPGGSWQLTATPESNKVRTTQADQTTGAITKGTDLTLSPLFNPSGLVGYWKFDEGTGTSAADSSGNGNRGTWGGTGSHWVTGKVGNAGQFNGTDDYVSAPYTSSLNVGQPGMTITAWVSPTTLSGNTGVLGRNGPYLFC